MLIIARLLPRPAAYKDCRLVCLEGSNINVYTLQEFKQLFGNDGKSVAYLRDNNTLRLLVDSAKVVNKDCTLRKTIADNILTIKKFGVLQNNNKNGCLVGSQFNITGRLMLDCVNVGTNKPIQLNAVYSVNNSSFEFAYFNLDACKDFFELNGSALAISHCYSLKESWYQFVFANYDTRVIELVNMSMCRVLSGLMSRGVKFHWLDCVNGVVANSEINTVNMIKTHCVDDDNKLDVRWGRYSKGVDVQLLLKSTTGKTDDYAVDLFTPLRGEKRRN